MLICKEEEFHYRMPRYFPRGIRFFLCLIFVSALFLSGCSSPDTEIEPMAEYGDYGSSIAQTLASLYPYRKAYSQSEKQAGEYIKTEFEKLGYEVEEQFFWSPSQAGSSTNYIVRIEGEGLMFRDSRGNYNQEQRQVIVGAHYDTSYGVLDAGKFIDFDGIQDNACGIGCLLTLAKELRYESMGYDVVLVAFGAASDSYAGAKAYTSKMTEEEIAAADVMYCVESIYAGDKLYANAGWNSLEPGKKYENRRKLYEVYDVVYENRLSSKNGVDLLYNESGQSLDVDGDGSVDVFREVTTTLSDYVPFDKAGIPIVFIESYDYNYTNAADMKETKNLKLQAYGGMIRRTNLDSVQFLEEFLPEDQLSTRINNTAFILLKAIEKGAHNSLSMTEYAEGITLAPTIRVTATPAAAGASEAASTTK